MLNAISPIDGRYRRQTESLAAYFSEAALIKYRVRVEAEYLIALAGTLPELKEITAKSEVLRDLYRNFTDADAQRVKEIEATTNHDVNPEGEDGCAGVGRV